MVGELPFALRTADGAFALDAQSRIVGWNQAAEALLGTPGAALAGKRCYEVLMGQDPVSGRVICGPQCAIRAAVQTGEPVPSHMLRLRAGDSLPVAVQCSVLLMGQTADEHSARVLVLLRRADTPARPPVAMADERAAPEPEASRPVLWVRTLGPLEALLNGEPLQPGRNWRPKTRLLLMFLLAHRPRPVAREVVAEALWPEASPAQARQSLRVVLHGLRQARAENGAGASLGDFIVSDATSVSFHPSARVWTDADEFWLLLGQAKTLADQGSNAEALAAYQQAVSCYQGDYLAEEPDAEWCRERREHLREHYLQALSRMAHLSAEQGDLHRSITVCQHLLTLDPTREAAWQDLIRYHCLAGLRTEALRAYQRCRRVLQRELGVEPLPETQALCDQIKDRWPARPHAATRA